MNSESVICLLNTVVWQGWYRTELAAQGDESKGGGVILCLEISQEGPVGKERAGRTEEDRGKKKRE